MTPADAPGRWLVLDTVHNKPVFGAEGLSKDRAYAMAYRLNEAYQLHMR